MRLFFALWPNEAEKLHLAHLLKTQLSSDMGRRIPAENWHVTLLFLGQIAVPRGAAVERSAERVSAAPFRLELQRLEFWRRPGVLCLTAAEVPQGLQHLHDALRAAIVADGFAVEEREYRPHLTVARDVLRAPRELTVPAVSLDVSEFVLVQSVPASNGSQYQIRARWPLNAAAPAEVRT